MRMTAARSRTPRARVRLKPSRGEGRARAAAGASDGRRCVDRAQSGVGAGDRGNQLCWSSNPSWLACTERDDATNRIVGRDAYGHPVAWNHFNAEAAHPAAQLGEHLVPGVTLHAVETAAVDRHDSALHVDQVVLAQIASNPFSDNSYTDEGTEGTSSPRRN